MNDNKLKCTECGKIFTKEEVFTGKNLVDNEFHIYKCPNPGCGEVEKFVEVTSDIDP